MKVKYDKNLFIKNSCLKLEYFECECFVISIEDKISKNSPTNEMSKIWPIKIFTSCDFKRDACEK